MRRLAAPFLITASMAAPVGAQPAVPASAPPMKTTNPPSPGVETPGLLRRQVTSVPTKNGTIRREANGRCRLYVNVKCPPGVMCNPPPPQGVPCPPQLLPLPTAGETVIKGPDGTCRAIVDVKCPPNANCNPPPPRPVQCPPAKPPTSQPISTAPTP